MIRTNRRVVNLVLCLFFVLASLTVFPMTASATPPKDILLSYDALTKTLKVTITHPSLIPTAHYIKIVSIKKNGVEVSHNFYKYQPGKKTFTYTYTIAAENGDTLQVMAVCNLYGNKTIALKVVKPPEKAGK